MGITVDSSFIIDVLRNDRGAAAKSVQMAGTPDSKFLTTPVIYEITAGLLHTGSRTEAAAFRTLASRFTVLPFDEPSAIRAAEVRAELLRLGRTKGHVDVMIAGIAAQGGHSLVTRDRDFQQIAKSTGLTVEGY